MKKYSVVSLFFILFFPGCMTGVNNFNNGTKYLQNHQYEMGINEYKASLDEIHNDPTKSIFFQTLEFSCYNNIAICYFFLSDYKSSYDYYIKSAESWPERAYYPYLGVALLEYMYGNINAAYNYTNKAYALVNKKEYSQLERESAFNADTLKKRVYALRDFYNMLLLYSELKQEYYKGNKSKVKQLAKKILSQNYHVDIGIESVSNYVDYVTPGSIADMNGILIGDQIKSINNKAVNDLISTNNELSNLYDKFDSAIDIRIIRNNRDMTISCRLYYPELEQTKKMLSNVENGKLNVNGSMTNNSTFGNELNDHQFAL